MASTATFQNRSPAPLTGGVACPAGGIINGADRFRRYRAGLTVTTPGRGRDFTEFRSIFYEVGRRHGGVNDSLAQADAAAYRIDCSVRMNPTLAANFEGIARTYSNFSPQWEYMDLAGVVERLARAVATQSVFGGVGTTNIRAGQAVRVVALGTLDSPQTASTSSVFIPRTVDAVGNDHVFAVMCAAVNGEGASVTTDVLRIDATTNAPIVPAVNNHALASACVEALRILGANMEESGAGDLFSYALTRGIHSVVSVVSHTDEGGVSRDLLRSDAFRVPYGGINQALRRYPGLPSLAGSSAEACAAWVDNIALKTAALVAHCDPLVPGDGGYFPTVFTSSHGAITAPGTDEGELEDRDGLAIGRQIASDVGRFAPLYCAGLVALFGLTSNSNVAEGHYCAAAAHYIEGHAATNRHLRHKTVAPYFWIEPTSLIPHDFLGSAAEANDFGAKVTAGSERSQPCFEQFTELGTGTTANHVTVAFKMRSARTSGWVASQATMPDVLGNVRLYQFDTSAIVLAGDQAPAGDVPTKHAAAAPISSYLWVRGQSALPAPAEFVNTQSVYGAKMKLVEWDDDFNATGTDVPLPSAMANETVRWRVSLPTGIPMGASNYADRAARRARSRAAIALAQSVARARAFGEGASPSMEVSDVPPVLGWSAPPPRPYGDTLPGTHNSDPGNTHVRGEDNVPPLELVNRGAALAPVEHHRAQGGVRLPPQPQQLGRAAGGPPPPAPGGQGPRPPPVPPGGEPPMGGVQAPAQLPNAAAGAPAAPQV